MSSTDTESDLDLRKHVIAVNIVHRLSLLAAQTVFEGPQGDKFIIQHSHIHGPRDLGTYTLRMVYKVVGRRACEIEHNFDVQMMLDLSAGWDTHVTTKVRDLVAKLLFEDET